MRLQRKYRNRTRCTCKQTVIVKLYAKHAAQSFDPVVSEMSKERKCNQQLFNVKPIRIKNVYIRFAAQDTTINQPSYTLFHFNWNQMLKCVHMRIVESNGKMSECVRVHHFSETARASDT